MEHLIKRHETEEIVHTAHGMDECLMWFINNDPDYEEYRCTKPILDIWRDEVMRTSHANTKGAFA